MFLRVTQTHSASMQIQYVSWSSSSSEREGVVQVVANPRPGHHSACCVVYSQTLTGRDYYRPQSSCTSVNSQIQDMNRI